MLDATPGFLRLLPSFADLFGVTPVLDAAAHGVTHGRDLVQVGPATSYGKRMPTFLPICDLKR